MQAVWWLILAASAVIYVILAWAALPKRMLRVGYLLSSPLGRGIKNYRETEGGRSIVYEPKPKYRRFVSQYILSQRNGKKALLCKVDENLSYLDYDIALFDAYGKPFSVLNVRENIVKPGYTRIVTLPQRTSFVSLIVNFADNTYIDNEKIKGFALKSRIFYYAVMSALTFFEIIFLKLCIAKIFGDVFVEDFMLLPSNLPGTILIGIAAAAAGIAVAEVFLTRSGKKLKGKERGAYEV